MEPPMEAKPMALVRNKRKSTEPSKVIDSSTVSHSHSHNHSHSRSLSQSHTTLGPLKKRIRYTSSADSGVLLTPPAECSPPPPGSAGLEHVCRTSQALAPHCHEAMPHPAHVFVRHPGVTTLHRDYAATQPEQEAPLELVTKKQPQQHNNNNSKSKQAEGESELSLELNIEEDNDNDNGKGGARPQQRNYKNMTRERRIEANARERTRVHTISAAYETLRRSVPAYASSQKLSKLSVLRVACSYILALSRMAGEDYSADRSEPSIAECMEAVTATIQTEGKVKRKKDE
ncbi:net [Drosophila busckii]|uniref:Net n=2 Tax=Drosophila busckii TaxID=30019 RepID=A0A0M4E359_DROBS|nr:net [Drosophila busckii]